MAERNRWFWPTAVLAMLGVWLAMFALVHRGGLVADDLLNLRLYRQYGFGVDFLLLPVFDHFAPGHRAITALQSVLGPTNVGTMHAVLVSIAAVGFLLLVGVLRELYGTRPWVLPVAALATLTYYAVDVQLWFAAAFHQVPEITFMLGSILAYLRYRRAHHRGWLLLSASLLGLGMLFVVKVLLVVPFLLLLEHVVLSDHPLRRVPGDVVAHWRRWTVFAVPVVIYLLVATLVLQEGPTAELGDLLGGLRLGWLARLGPALFGQQLDIPPFGSPTAAQTLRMLLYQGLIGLLFLASISRRRSSARALAAAVVVVLLALGLALTTRITLVGVGASLTYRYYLEAVVLASILLPWGFTGEPDPDAPRMWRAQRGAWVRRAVAAVALAVVAVNTAVSDLQVRETAMATASGAWLRTAQEAAAQEGVVELVNDRIPVQLVPSFLIGAFTLEDIVVYIDGMEVTGDPDGHILAEDGSLAPVDFTPFYEGTGSDFADNGLVTVDGETEERRQAVCMDDPVSFRIRLGPAEDKRYVLVEVDGDATVEYRPVTEPYPRPATPFYAYPTTTASPRVMLPIDVVGAQYADITVVPASGTVCLASAALGHLADDPPFAPGP